MNAQRTHLVFVYGSLRQGQGNSRCLTGARLRDVGIVRGFDLHDLGPFPAAVESSEPDDPDSFVRGVIRGEVYEVSDRILDRLDDLEGVRWNYYNRKRTTFYSGLNGEGHAFEVWIYYMDERCASQRSHGIVEGGDWVRWQLKISTAPRSIVSQRVVWKGARG